MKNVMRFFIGISLLVLIACWGCGENSEAEMKQAEQAMEKAKSLFAEDLAPTNWVDAMKEWEKGQAAVKQGKPAKTIFTRAKSRFEKTAAIAQAQGENLSKEVTSIQLAVGERIGRIRAALDRGRVSPKIQKQVKPLAAEVDEGMATIESLANQKNYLKARTLAREIQTKAYNAELILAGKKPLS